MSLQQTLILRLVILVVLGRLVPECVIVGSESTRVCVSVGTSEGEARAVSGWGVVSWVCVLPLMGQ